MGRGLGGIGFAKASKVSLSVLVLMLNPVSKSISMLKGGVVGKRVGLRRMIGLIVDLIEVGLFFEKMILLAIKIILQNSS